jgi:hypothetical protein
MQAARFTVPALRERKRPKGASGSLPYFAASCAHFASDVKNAFAPVGGSISPISDVRNCLYPA